MKIGYYPGCSLEGTSKEYNESVIAIAKALDIELQEINDWNCCGASAAHNMNHLLALSLPARSLALAEQQGIDEILIPCAACYNRLGGTALALSENPKLLAEVADVIEMPFQNKVKTINVVDFLGKYVTPILKERLVKKFSFKTACYYGCLLVRPTKFTHIERSEDPDTMETIMRIIGSNPVDWSFKTECCGAGLSVSRTDIVARLSGNILRDAVSHGAEAIIVACPMCHSNLDLRRDSINEAGNTNIQTPVIFITQAIGISLGLDPAELGLKRHMVESAEIIYPAEPGYGKKR